MTTTSRPGATKYDAVSHSSVERFWGRVVGFAIDEERCVTVAVGTTTAGTAPRVPILRINCGRGSMRPLETGSWPPSGPATQGAERRAVPDAK